MVYIIDVGPVEKKEGIIHIIEEDRNNFMRSGDKLGLDKSRLILGEIQRDPNKDTSDKNVSKILKQIRKQSLKHPEPDMLLISLIDTYIDPPVSDDELLEWVDATIGKENIKKLGKKAFKIIGNAKKHFGEREINSNALKDYIDSILES
jgi:uncharacterized protein YqeY